MLKTGLNRVRDLVAADIDRGELGTSGTAPKSTDTDLGTADANSIATLSITKADKQVNANYTLVSTSGSTGTYKEYKNYNNSTSSNYDRIVFTGIGFTTNGTEDLKVTKRYFIQSG